MLQKSIDTKQQLISVVNAASIKKIIGADIQDKKQLQEIMKNADDIFKSSNQLTVILIETRKK